MLYVVIAGNYINKPNIIDAINMHNPAMYVLDDHIDGYADAFLIIKNTISLLTMFKFVILMFIPAKKHTRKKPFLKRCDVDELSLQALQDGINSSDSINYGDDTKQDTWDHYIDTVDKVKEALFHHKSNQQNDFLILVNSDNHGDLTVKYQFLHADDIAKIAVLCKQPQLPGDKAVCFIDSTHEVTNTCISANTITLYLNCNLCTKAQKLKL